MALTGKRVAILVENQYQVLEVWYPLLRLREEGATTFTVGTGGSTRFLSKEGYPVEADRDIEGIRAEEVDCVIVPGGYAPDILRRYAGVNRLVREVYERSGVVAAICHGGWVLVSAGILKGKRVTCFEAIKDDVVNAGAEYVDVEVVRDGKLVTSRKPADLPAFCREIIAALNE